MMVRKKTVSKSKATAKTRKKAAGKSVSGRSKPAAKKTKSVKRAAKRKPRATVRKASSRPSKASLKKKSTKTAKKAGAKKAAAVSAKKRAAGKTAAGKAAAKSAGKKPSAAPKKGVKRAEKRSRAVEKLLALKDEKAKNAAKKQDFLIRAPKKKNKPTDLVATQRFVRRLTPAPASTVSVARPAGRKRKAVLRKRDLEELRRALEEERQRLIDHLAHLDDAASLKGPTDVNEDVPGYSIHLAEYASDNQAVETTLVQRAMQAERLAEIEQALQRIDQPGYGICQGCGSTVGIERLKIKPFAALCVHCRELKEQGQL